MLYQVSFSPLPLSWSPHQKSWSSHPTNRVILASLLHVYFSTLPVTWNVSTGWLRLGPPSSSSLESSYLEELLFFATIIKHSFCFYLLDGVLQLLRRLLKISDIFVRLNSSLTSSSRFSLGGRPSQSFQIFSFELSDSFLSSSFE